MFYLQSSSRSAPSSRESTAGGGRGVVGEGLQPRPPSKPADPTLLRVQKQRVRIISGGKRKPDTSSRVSKTESVDSGLQTATSLSSVATTDHSGTEPPAPVEDHLLHDEHLALDVLKYKDSTMSGSYYTSKGNEGLNASGVSDDYMNSTSDSQISNTSNTTMVSDMDSSVDEVLYLYRSLPRSAERKQSGFKVPSAV